MNYRFESKIAVETPQKQTLLQKLCVVGGILAVICTLATILIDGFSGVSFLTGIFLPAFLLCTGIAKRAKIDYVPTQVLIEIFEHRVVISYPSVSRYLNTPPISEVFEYNAGDMQNFQYSSELNAIRFYGFPVTTIGGKRDESKRKLREKVVYLPGGVADELCQHIEKSLGISTEKMS